MNISTYYEKLKVHESATDEEINSSYKRLARVYHPDKNPQKVEWATEAMKDINIAYNAIMSHRFSTRSADENHFAEEETPEKKRDNHKKSGDINEKANASDLNEELYIKKFIRIRENAKDSIYKYFQYGLHSIPKREQALNRGIFNEIVYSLRVSYHSINKLMKQSKEKDSLNHFEVFNKMIFNFYKASECINIIDSYSDTYEVRAYRTYMKGDEKLHYAHREVFFDRHNRGFYKSNSVFPLLRESKEYFLGVVEHFPLSTWVVEAQIKIDYINALLEYLRLFFSNE